MVGERDIEHPGQDEYQSQWSGTDAGQREHPPFGVTTDRTPPPTGTTVQVVNTTGTVIGTGTYNPTTGVLETNIRTTTIIEQTSPPQTTTVSTGLPSSGVPMSAQAVTVPQRQTSVLPKIDIPKHAKNGRYSLDLQGGVDFGVDIRPVDMVSIKMPKGYWVAIQAYDAGGNKVGEQQAETSGDSYAYPVGAAYVSVVPFVADDKYTKSRVTISWSAP
jgi:hypothetical protein